LGVGALVSGLILFGGRYCLHILFSGKIRVRFQEECEKGFAEPGNQAKRSRDFQAVWPAVQISHNRGTGSFVPFTIIIGFSNVAFIGRAT
jgi:hypothetical protein